MRLQHEYLRKSILVIFLLLFGACDDAVQEACKDSENGKIVNYTSKGVLPADYINSLKPSLGVPDSFSAQYDVKVYSVDYETTDPNGNVVIASGAVYYPQGLEEPLSLLSGQHGLTIKRSEVASLIPVYGYLGLFGASIGYVGIQPDYLGLGNSTFPYYPVYQKSNGKVLLDMVEGVQAFSCENDIELNENLFVIGYSNGGYNSIAMHDELSKNPRTFDIDASVIIAGYFDLERGDNFSIPQRLVRPSWAIYHPYVINRTYNLNIIDHDIDVIVELIGGVDVARDLILKALNAKKNVVTANKAVIFNHGDELFSVANKNGVKLLYESSVCAGTPIIKLLNQELAASKISKISGMLNGTSNFILSNMEEGMEFEPTLKLAQEKGYAEPDPSFDIEGTDAAHKIGILSSLAFGSSLPPKDFYIEGINGIHKDDFKYAYEMGYTIKHLAIAKSTNNSIDLRAHPSLVKLDSYLANLKGVRNGIEVETDLLGTLHIAGSGAGQEATASGVISDLIYLSDSKIREVNNINENIELIDFIAVSYTHLRAHETPEHQE